jgi:hypothetical protein
MISSISPVGITQNERFLSCDLRILCKYFRHTLYAYFLKINLELNLKLKELIVYKHKNLKHFYLRHSAQHYPETVRKPSINIP